MKQFVAFMKLTERKPKEPFDPNKLYAYTVKYYVDKKGYSVEHANQIARSITEREIARHKQKQGTLG